jgi:NAD(P)-dependent dehydrogenase (short-subunit alcohol dehydrogenase family)
MVMRCCGRGGASGEQHAPLARIGDSRGLVHQSSAINYQPQILGRSPTAIGNIVINGSMASSKGIPAFGVYAATKATLRSFARTWAVDLKGAQHPR